MLLQLLRHLMYMAIVEAIFAQAPCHHAAELMLGDYVVELAGDQLGSVPGPEELVGFVEVVLAASLVVGDTVGHRLLP